MSRKPIIIKITKYDNDPSRIGDKLEISSNIIGNVKPKNQVKQNKNKTKKPKMTVEKLANILMEFIARQEQFNRNIVKLNNLKTE
ncbi:MAG: hypothetical protein LBQ45_01130 [Mycoplasmataceae bacterium]|jgi:hypothetical protein|nr:hypothetical protein [Mycoplasmataceae bacterium]